MTWKILAITILLGTTPGSDPGDPAPQDEPELFVPSEKLPADSAVSFPVDI